MIRWLPTSVLRLMIRVPRYLRGARIAIPPLLGFATWVLIEFSVANASAQTPVPPVVSPSASSVGAAEADRGRLTRYESFDNGQATATELLVRPIDWIESSASESGQLELRFDHQGTQQSAAFNQLWHWQCAGGFSPPQGMLLLLSDGSLLTIDSLVLDQQRLVGQSRLFGKVDLAKEAVQGVLLQPMVAAERRALQLAQLIADLREVRDNAGLARCRLTSSDWVDGELSELVVLGSAESSAEIRDQLEALGRQAPTENRLDLSANDRTIRLGISSVEWIVLPNATPTAASLPALSLALSDGSQLQLRGVARQENPNASSWTLQLQSGLKLTIDASTLFQRLENVRSLGSTKAERLPHRPISSGIVPLFSDSRFSDLPVDNTLVATSSFQIHEGLVRGEWHQQLLEIPATGTVVFELPSSDGQLRGSLGCSERSPSAVIGQIFVMDSDGNWQAAPAWSQTVRQEQGEITFSIRVSGAKAIAFNASPIDDRPPSGISCWLDLSWER